MTLNAEQCAAFYEKLASVTLPNGENAQNVLKCFEEFFKPTKSLGDEMLENRKALQRALMSLGATDNKFTAENILYNIVYYRAPKLSAEHHHALKVLEAELRREGMLSRLYHSPVTRGELARLSVLAKRKCVGADEGVAATLLAASQSTTPCMGGDTWDAVVSTE